ncbi:hypothetical protein [Microbacterium marinilacus]|uniref:Aspartate/glutamate racemase family protein n=1 Tax=Microbacterium marinilacus TaxID=415209 RepID=A0ABP7BTN8_9MICO|nr:hypothetical protein [Microbacterium marinilacus]MBY0688228.1 hypothetical protein [Microbacterium marinilacus]
MSAPYGSRGRLGLILPADNVVIEPELAEFALEGVSVHGFRLTAIEHAAMREQAVELAAAIVESGVDAVVYACAETSFSGGEDSRRSLAGLIAERCGVPVVTATNATIAAARAAGIARPVLVAPYTDRSRRQLETVLRAEGIPPVASVSRDFRVGSGDPREWFATNRLADDSASLLARGSFVADADGVVIASTNWPTLRRLPELEAQLGAPVVSSNLAILWWAARTFGLAEELSRPGALLAGVASRVAS